VIGRALYRAHIDAFADTLLRLRREWVEQLLSVIVIGIALALPAAAWLAVDNTRAVAANWDGSPRISLYLKPGLSVTKGEALTDTVSKMAGVKRAHFISRSEGLESLKTAMQLGDLLALLDDNPLPHVIEVTPLAASDDGVVTALAGQLGKLSGVERARLDLAWVKRFFALLGMLQRLVVVLAIALGVAVLFVVGSTIRLAISSRRDEIEISKLVGASDAFVRRPLLYFGAQQGLLGGVMACLLLFLSSSLLAGSVERLALLYDSPFRLQGLGVDGALLLLLIGAGLGWSGAWIVSYRQLRAVEPA